MNQNLKSKLLFSIIIVFMMLSTFSVYNAYAEQITPEMISKGNGMANGKVGAEGILTYNDLVERYDIFCCSHGSPLSTGFYTIDSVVTATPEEAYILSEMKNNSGVTKTFVKKLDENGNPIEHKYEEFKDDPELNTLYIKISETENLTVYNFKNKEGKDIFVMQDPSDEKYYEVIYGTNSGTGVYTYVQLAWWKSRANIGIKDDLIDNGLALEAKAFEKYINNIAVKKDGKIVYEEQEYTVGDEKGTVEAPKLEYKAEFKNNSNKSENESFDYDNPTVIWDENEQLYKIGPFSINYEEASKKVEGRDKVVFAGIEDVKLYTDAYKEPLKRGEDWDFIWLKGQRTENEKSEFPKSNETFYIYLKYMDNATKITDFEFDFKYMNAGGKYEKLTGWYGESRASQQLAGGLLGVRWYNKLNIHWNKPMELTTMGKIRIEKRLLTAQERELKSDKYFNFDLYVQYPGEEEARHETIQVKAGGSAESSVYTWKKGDMPPKYSIVEKMDEVLERTDYGVVYGKIGDEKYRVYIDPSEGSLASNETITVKAYNIQTPREGSIEIKKEVTDDSLNGKEFEFYVVLSGTFRFQGKNYENDKVEVPLKIKGGETAKIEGIEWYGQDAPWYEVTEEKSDIAETISITPSKGNLTDNKPVEIKALNGPKYEKAYLRIFKTFEIPEGNVFPVDYIEEYVKTLSFEFEVEVEGYGKSTVKLDTPRKTEIGYEWTYTSDEYTWVKGTDAPKYTIKEINCPEGTEFSSASSKHASLDGKTLYGTLVSDADTKFYVDNHIINKIVTDTGKLQIEKTIEGPNGAKDLINKDYNFIVKVKAEKGAFRYKDTWYAPGTEITLTNSGIVKEGNNEKYVVIHVDESKNAIWKSDDFEWIVDCEPTCTVEEDLIGLEDVKLNMPVKTLSLKAGETVTFSAKNYIEEKEKEKAKLHLIKTLENADKFSEEEIAKLEFKFKIEVDGYVDSEVTLKNPRKEDNTYIWEYTSDYYEWEKGTEAHYKITEIETPEGTEFSSASSDYATLKDKTLEGKLVSDETKDFIIDNNIINKAVVNEGKLKILKNVKDESLKGKSFFFDIELKGTFEYNGVTYKDGTFKIENFEVKGGESAEITGIKWYGSKDNGPRYTVTEKTSDIAELESIQNASGRISTKSEVTVTATNKVKYKEGTLKLTKKIAGNNVLTDKKFRFEISVDGNEIIYKDLKAGETFEQKYTWKATENAPKYTVKEIQIPEDFKFVSLTNGQDTKNSESEAITGSLAENQTVELTCINEAKDLKEGFLKIKKEAIIDEKVYEDSDEYKNFLKGKKFTIKVELFGTFEHNGKSYVKDTENPQNPQEEVEFEIEAGEIYTLDGIKWSGDQIPTYKVSEIEMPEGWKKLNISNESGTIKVKDKNITGTTNMEVSADVVVTNLFVPVTEINLLTEFAGEVWEDRPQDESGKNTEGSKVNGLRDDNEDGIDGVEVYVKRVMYQKAGNELKEVEGTRQDAKAFKNTDLKEEIVFPLITENNGKWIVEGMPVPAFTDAEKEKGYTPQNGYLIKYDVEFVYDGQTYEPTKFLATSNGNPAEYINAKTSARDNWAKDSKAVDFNREEVNSRLETITGKAPIDSEGNTIGTALSTDGKESSLNYKSYDYSYSDTSRKVSKVQTTDDRGVALDLFKTKARTSTGGLTYLFDDEVNISNADKKLVSYKKDPVTFKEQYVFKATYNYTKNINLGLVRREEADLSTVKDLDSAKVVVNEKLLNYKFNTLADLTGDTITRQLQAQQMGIKYDLGLYKTDYYYRAEIYQSNGTVYDARDTFYKTLGTNLDSTELDVYLTYKISLYNESPTYDVKINSVDDYFDSTFKLITAKEMKYVQTIDGKPANELEEVANVSTISTGGNINWEIVETGIKGSDGTTYNKMTANLENVRLASGEKADIFVTFKVDKSDINGIRDSIITGNKSNVAEIASYSTYNKGEDKTAGKIDRDSAPANIDIRNHNDKTWYEDDTDSAPILNLKLTGENRTIDGKAWEDKETETIEYGQKVGNGKYEEEEALIGGLTTELVEKVTIKNPEGTYTDYDFLWPTNKNLDFLNGRTFEELTGFDSITETSRDNENGKSVGQYKFVGVPAGNYVVRFLYGNDKTALPDTDNITEDAVALDKDGKPYSGDSKLLTANYNKENIAVYNGQDYKSTTYQPSSQTVNNAWHNFDAKKDESDARDSEARRLEIIANSETITNVNGKILKTANDLNANHKDLYTNYYMFADSAKLNLNIENASSDTVSGTRNKNGNESQVLTYNVKGIDLGLEKRSESKIVLDKEINSIKLITNDGNTIFDAKYNISYDKVEKSKYKNDCVKVAELDDVYYLVAIVTLEENSIGKDNMQAINKIENDGTGTQNFRYINIDDTILQGTTIQIGYTITALNVGEPDRVGEELYNLTTNRDSKIVKEGILDAAKKVSKEFSTYNDSSKIEIGKYLGKTYYEGKENKNDKIVTTTVRQVIDYVDNEAVFSSTDNSGIDNSWRNATINEITGNGIEADRLIDENVVIGNTITDKNGLEYVTSQRNNIVLSVDSIEDKTELTNKGFEKELVPYSVNENGYSSAITLTVSRTVSSQDDADNLAFDNLAEIVKIENTVGRRDITSLPGNANPKLGEFKVSLNERDSSATELVTLTPPTGIEVGNNLKIQILAVTAVALVILAGGVVIIKKRVLK